MDGDKGPRLWLGSPAFVFATLTRFLTPLLPWLADQTESLGSSKSSRGVIPTPQAQANRGTRGAGECRPG
jgi:hypothetical protein